MKIDVNSYQLYGYRGDGDPLGRAAGKTAKAAAGKDAKDRADKQKIERTVQQLKATEQRVIAHEMAHKAVGGRYAGAVSYEYRIGPDGKMYIVGGEVSIDMSSGSTPDQTLQKMEQVRMAALAPADPSPQDYKVAQEASMLEDLARQELVRIQMQSGAQKYKNGNQPGRSDSLANISIYT
ncbi:MAG: putative metalloprotease CJM1_0395 family protein [Desulfobacteraceae bacterium]|nr:putative metalloprotease CJM1_0395 family protein [Desulfobacteraceae bacterium]